VTNSQIADPSSNSALNQLIEVDAQLAAQEAELSAQLASIQQKRQSLKTVIELFASGATAQAVAAPVATPIAETNGKLNTSILEQETPELDDSTVTDIATPAADKQNHKAQKTPANERKSQSAKSTRTTKVSKKPEGWQHYVRAEFNNLSLSEAVSTVLHQQAGQALEIGAILDAIFVEQMPSQTRFKARRQVTNILTDGARKNKWQRPQPGSYSISP
jgi:hypothetical protein